MASELGRPADETDRGNGGGDEEHLVAGRYRLVHRIGTGAMGVVWQGHDERLGRAVAVKKLLLHPGLPPAKSDEAVARCLREGRIAAKLQHPNAITVFDVVDEDGVPCLVMEYLQSRSMATVMAEEGPLAPAEVAGIGAQVAAALAAAHAAGIVHRDVTPGNILLGEDGSVKLTDFGISRAADDGTVTRTGLFAGTPAYLAPEVALGGDPSPASDVFSLGSALYAAVEGEPPFGLSANALGLLHAVAGGRINPPQRSGPLTDVLNALLAADPQARPTASAACDLLAAVSRGEIPEQPPVPVVVAAPVVPAGPAQADEGIALVAGSTELIPQPSAPAASASAPAEGARRPLVLVGAFVIALVAAGIWLLGSRSGLAPADDQEPVNGTIHGKTTPTSVSAPVAPVAVEETDGGEQTPKTDARKPGTAATPEVKTPPPAPTTTTTTPPPTTTTSTTTVPTTPVTTTPPTTSSETTTPPPPPSEDVSDPAQ